MRVKKELKMINIEKFTSNVTRFLLIVFFVIPGVSLFSLDVAGITWGPNLPSIGERIIFGTDNRFYIGVQESRAEGTYSQTGNSITLDYVWGFYRELGNMLSIVEINDHLFFSYKLVGSGGKEFFGGNQPPQGAERKINGIAVYVYNAEGEVNENARMRVGPGVQYSNVMFNSKQVIVPKAQAVTIWGRSENQTTIGGVTAYWYYCGYMADYDEYARGWIWGSLIDFRQ
jgi:hypothetical protein